jgi:cell division protein FtsL
VKHAVLEIALAVVLLAGVVGSGIELVTTAHESRRLFGELELLRLEGDRLRDEWSALTLEVSTLAGHARIDTIAREQLGLIEPDEHRLYVEVVP